MDEQKPGTSQKKEKHGIMQSSRHFSHANMDSCVPEIAPVRSERTTLANLLQLAAVEQQSKEQAKELISLSSVTPPLNGNFNPSSSQLDAENEDTFSDAATDTLASTEAVTATYHVSLDGHDEDHLLSYTNMASRDFIMRRFLSAAKTKALETSKVFERWPVEMLSPFVKSPMLGGPLSPASSTKDNVLFTEEDERTHCGYTNACGLFPLRLRNTLLRSSISRRPKFGERTNKDALLGSESKQEGEKGKTSLRERQARIVEITKASRVHHHSPREVVECPVVTSSSFDENRLGTLELQEERCAEGRMYEGGTSSCFQTPRASLGDAKVVFERERACLEPLLMTPRIGSSNLGQRMGEGPQIDTRDRCRPSSCLSKMVMSHKKLHEVLLQRRGVQEQVCLPDTEGAWKLSQTDSVTNMQTDLCQRHVVFSLPLPKSPTESWLWKALQLKGPPSFLNSNPPLPTPVSARRP